MGKFISNSLLCYLNGKIINYRHFFISCFNHKTSDESDSNYCLRYQGLTRCTDDTAKNFMLVLSTN